MDIIVPLSLTANTTRARTNYVPLPPVVDCPGYPLSPWLNNIGDGWNCNLCASESSYHILYERGDILSFQTALPDLKNPAPDLLVAGWQLSTNPPFVLAYVKAQLYDCTGTNLISGDVDLFAFDYWVSFNENIGSIQNFTIDTASLPVGLEQFRIKLTTYDAANNVDVVQWSEIYSTPQCGRKTVLLKSNWKNLDCSSHYHGIPSVFLAQSSPPPVGYVPVPYSSSFRLYGEIYQDAISTSQTLNENDRVLSQDITETWILDAFAPLPPFAVSMLKDALYGDNLTIFSDNLPLNGQVFTNPSAIERGGEAGRAFVPQITVDKVCKNYNKFCN